jgi:NAD(P)H-dependent FMN reductase
MIARSVATGPAARRRQCDYVYADGPNKATAFVGYGTIGGARADEHLRAVMSGMQVAHVAQQLSRSLFTDFQDGSTCTPGPQHERRQASCSTT